MNLLTNSIQPEAQTLISNDYIVKEHSLITWDIPANQIVNRFYGVGIAINGGKNSDSDDSVKLEIKSSALAAPSIHDNFNSSSSYQSMTKAYNLFENRYRNRCLEDAYLHNSCSNFLSDSLKARIDYDDPIRKRHAVAKYMFEIVKSDISEEDFRIILDVKTNTKCTLAIILQANEQHGLVVQAKFILTLLIIAIYIIESLIVYYLMKFGIST